MKVDIPQLVVVVLMVIVEEPLAMCLGLRNMLSEIQTPNFYSLTCMYYRHEDATEPVAS